MLPKGARMTEMKYLFGLTMIAALALSPLAADARDSNPIAPVRGVDLSRYMGRWYVIAAVPTRFERAAYNAVETYQRNADGTICTWFRQRPGSFEAPVKLIESTASVRDGSGNGEWRVHLFAFLNAQYLVGWLKSDYSQALVVRDARDYLWFMARTPTVSDADYAAMLGRVEAMGYDPAMIRKVPQRWPEHGDGSESFAGTCR